MGMKYKDYYKLLGIERNSSEAAIKKAYRKLARQYHPDVNKEPGAQGRFQEISEAYEVLGDPEKRKRYDELGANWQQGQEFTPPHEWENVHFEFGGGNGARGFSFGGAGGGFSDFFESIFGDMMGGRSSFQGAEHFQTRPRPRRRTHDEVELTLTLEEAFRGGKKRISVYAASGSKPKTYDLNIPPGTRDGARLRLRNQGQNGDLLIRIHIAPHPRFKVDGADLETPLLLAPHEAVLGGRIVLQLLDGRASLNIPPGIQPGKKFKLSGKGLKKPGGGHGDLYAVVQITVPKNPSDEERKLYEQLAKLKR